MEKPSDDKTRAVLRLYGIAHESIGVVNQAGMDLDREIDRRRAAGKPPMAIEDKLNYFHERMKENARPMFEDAWERWKRRHRRT
jgi:hypothetical protein